MPTGFFSASEPKPNCLSVESWSSYPNSIGLPIKLPWAAHFPEASKKAWCNHNLNYHWTIINIWTIIHQTGKQQVKQWCFEAKNHRTHHFSTHSCYWQSSLLFWSRTRKPGVSAFTRISDRSKPHLNVKTWTAEDDSMFNLWFGFKWKHT